MFEISFLVSKGYYAAWAQCHQHAANHLYQCISVVFLPVLSVNIFIGHSRFEVSSCHMGSVRTSGSNTALSVTLFQTNKHSNVNTGRLPSNGQVQETAHVCGGIRCGLYYSSACKKTFRPFFHFIAGLVEAIQCSLYPLHASTAIW